MTRTILSTTLLSLSLSTTAVAQTAPKNNVNIGLVYPISTNGINAATYSNTFSLNAIAGVSKNERAFCASGIANVIRDSATGVVASGLANVIGNSACGLQAAGFINYTRNYTEGVQAAGFMNMTGNMKGIQAAGFANVATGNVTGAQAAGFINLSHNSTTQLAGYLNIADSTTTQAAGFINVADEVKAAQVAGFINVAHSSPVQAAGFINIAQNTNTQLAGFINVAENVSGAQVAGFINVAHKVKGAQIAGFINIADSCDYPIGLINLVKNGEKALGVTVDGSGTTLATFRSGGHIMYGIVGAGINLNNSRALYAAQAGLGAHLNISKALRINGEATITTLSRLMHGHGGVSMETGIRILPSLYLSKFELFAGPSVNYSVSADDWNNFPTHNSFWNDNYRCHNHELYMGVVAGVQIHF